MRRSWPKARDFVIQSGWIPVTVSLGLRRIRTMTLFRDPLRPDRDPVYLHVAEAREDWRRFIVRSVMES